jgi:hypothetical protein
MLNMDLTSMQTLSYKIVELWVNSRGHAYTASHFNINLFISGQKLEM